MPHIGRYNPNYRAVDRNIRGQVTMKPRLAETNVLLRKKGIVKKFKKDVRKKLNFKLNRSEYIKNVIIQHGEKKSAESAERKTEEAKALGMYWTRLF